MGFDRLVSMHFKSLMTILSTQHADVQCGARDEAIRGGDRGRPHTMILFVFYLSLLYMRYRPDMRGFGH